MIKWKHLNRLIIWSLYTWYRYCSFSSVRLSIVLFIVSLHVIINDIAVLVPTRLHHLQDGCKTSVQGRKVWFREQGGCGCQRVLSQGLTHDVAQTETRERQETQAEEGGATNPAQEDGKWEYREELRKPPTEVSCKDFWMNWHLQPLWVLTLL